MNTVKTLQAQAQARLGAETLADAVAILLVRGSLGAALPALVLSERRAA